MSKQPGKGVGTIELPMFCQAGVGWLKAHDARLISKEDKMKVLVEDEGTGKFLMEKGQWTRDYRKAKDFGQSSLAIQYAVKEGLVEVSLLLVFGTDRGMDVRLNPFAPESGLKARSGTAIVKTLDQQPSRSAAKNQEPILTGLVPSKQ
jgi:hypothetical protein